MSGRGERRIGEEVGGMGAQIIQEDGWTRIVVRWREKINKIANDKSSRPGEVRSRGQLFQGTLFLDENVQFGRNISIA